MKQLITLLFVLLATTTVAQVDGFEEFRRKAESAFNAARESHDNRFEQHRAEINRRYADHIRNVWSRYDVSPSEPEPTRPDPVEPPVYAPPTLPAERPTADKPAPQPVPQPITVPAKPAPQPKPQPAPQPVVKPAAQPTAPQQPTVAFEFYGTQVELRTPGTGIPSLFALSEDVVANSWLAISKGGFDVMLEDCLAIKKSIGMGDWGYYCLVRDAATCYYGAQCNDNTLLQAYILTHSGFRLRLARKENRLYMLLNVSETIYGQPFFTLDGARYYFVESRVAPQSLQICNVQFPGEKGLSLQMTAPPRLAQRDAASIRFASTRYPELFVTLAPNKNLIDFYASYPTSPLSFYVHTSLSPALKDVLYPALKRATAQRPQREAVDVVLNFVQTAFAYKSDTYQFGREKWFFGDEMFFYPFCDCDDRAILFAVLVREVLGLDVVLLDYPEHISTAVRIPAAGDDGVVTVDGERYVVCDPTYINAGVGRVMSGLDSSKLKIVKL
ncbi:MAG: hypothetical protein IKA70_01395 [Alistipes sp.]|nr:hypothetical protein [Alistipes sp.]